MSVEATDQNNTKSNSLAASNIHYREDVKTNITQENNRIAVIGEYSEQKHRKFLPGDVAERRSICIIYL